MITLEMNEAEAKLLRNVLEIYHAHLEVEIVRTSRREFKEALKEREATLIAVSDKLKTMVKD